MFQNRLFVALASRSGFGAAISDPVERSSIVFCNSVSAEVWSVKFGVWSLEWEGSSEKWEVWSVDCEVWSVKCEVRSVKLGVWRKQWEVRSVKCGLWSVKCEVRSVKLGVWRKQWKVRSVKCEVWSLECEGSSEKWEVWSVKCEVWSVDCEVRSVKCGLWIVKCRLWSVKCEVWSVKEAVRSVKCGVWSLKFGLRRVQCAVWGVECRGKDTVGTGHLWTIGNLCLGNFRRRLARVYVILVIWGQLQLLRIISLVMLLWHHCNFQMYMVASLCFPRFNRWIVETLNKLNQWGLQSENHHSRSTSPHSRTKWITHRPQMVNKRVYAWQIVHVTRKSQQFAMPLADTYGCLSSFLFASTNVVS